MNELVRMLPEQFITYLRNGFALQSLDTAGWSIVTPFRHFDMSFIEIYVEPASGGTRISDGGETLNMLFVSGITVEEHPDLMKQAHRIATMHQVLLQDSILSAFVTEESVGEMVHQLVHTIQAIGFFVYYRSYQNHPVFHNEETLQNEPFILT